MTIRVWTVVAAVALCVGLVSEGSSQSVEDALKGMVGQSPTRTAPPAAPPPAGLRPGEFYVTTRNGCGLIAGPLPTTPPPAGQQPQTEASIRAFFAEREWTGECKYGLLHGVGELETPENRRKAADPMEGRGFGTQNTEYYLGTPLFVSSGRPWFATGTYMRVRHPDGRVIYAQNVQFPPAWGWNWTVSGFNRLPYEPETKVVGADKALARTVKEFCSDAARKDSSIHCARGPDYAIYGIESGIEGGATQTTWCPDPRTSVGCEDLWRTAARPILAGHTRFLNEEVKPAEDALRAEIDAKLATYIAGYAAAQKAREEAARIAEAAAIAAKEKEERAFRTSLTTLGAGQLFTKADDYDRAGDAEKARLTRRALIERFPNSPLAAQAAGQMSGGAPSSAGSRPSASLGTGMAGTGGASSPAASAQPNLCSNGLPYQGTNRRPLPTMADLQALTSSCQNELQVLRNEAEKTARYVNRPFNQQIYDGNVRYAQCLAFEAAQTNRTQFYIDQKTREINMTSSSTHNRAISALQLCAMRAASSGARAPAPTAPAPASPGAAPAAPAPRAATGCASTPQQSFRNFDNEFGQFTRANPNCSTAGTCPGAEMGAGSRAQNQYAYFVATQGLTILEKYRSCMAPSDYQANLVQLTAARDTGKRNCEAFSTNPGSCTPTYPEAWRRR